MRFNPSLTARLRIGFLILFTLLLAVSLLGVGRLFQIRVDFEDETSRYFQLELESERLGSSFILEQAAIRPPAPGEPPDAGEFERATEDFQQAAERADELAAGATPCCPPGSTAWSPTRPPGARRLRRPGCAAGLRRQGWSDA